MGTVYKARQPALDRLVAPIRSFDLPLRPRRRSPVLRERRRREDGMGLYGLSFFNVTSMWLIPSLVENSLGRSVPPGSAVHHFRVPLSSS